MSRHLVSLALVALLAACTSSHAPVQAPAPVHEMSAAPADLESKTVALVQIRDDGQGRAYCSGVWVGADTILTANHCVDDLELGDRVLYVTRADVAADHVDEVEVARLGALAARDEAHDLALIRVLYAPAHAIAPVATEAPYVGEFTQTMGHPLGLWWSYSAGLVSGVRQLTTSGGDMDPAMWWVQSTAPISPGNSGGGLFNARGELLGICHAYLPRGQSLYLYIHAQYVRAFLDGAS